MNIYSKIIEKQKEFKIAYQCINNRRQKNRETDIKGKAQ